jgi:murein DD-endopeptidase MepM/ murein hydrolase activator NlpD
VVLTVFAASARFAPSASGDSVSDARRDRERARAAQAQAAKQLDLLAAADADVARALADIDAAVTAAEAGVEDAQRALDAAQADAVQRQAHVQETEAAVEAAKARLTAIAVDRYVGRGADDTVLALFGASDSREATRRAALIEFVHGSRRDALDALRAVENERADALRGAQQSVAESDERRAGVAAALAELQDRRATLVRLRAELQRRTDEWTKKQDEYEHEEAQLTDLIKRKQLEALKVPAGSSGAASMTGFVRPARGAIGSGFGMRKHPILGIVRPHNGLDFAGNTGDPVFAAKEGRVIYAGPNPSFGNVIIIQHAGTVSTLYAHLSKIGVKSGDWVATGEAIGLIGSTGLSTGPHLHFEVRVNGDAKDPQLFLP